MRRSETGAWVPDWAEEEPDPIPVPTIAWITWHIGWWWSVTIDHLQGRTPRDRGAVGRLGDAVGVVTRMRELRAAWVAVLDGLTDGRLDAAAPFPWKDDPMVTVGHTIAWVNVELTKNAAEVGQLRLARAAA